MLAEYSEDLHTHFETQVSNTSLENPSEIIFIGNTERCPSPMN